MPGDELRDGSADTGARTGPRHAAPKKPLLTRLHFPAGKAIALAAMPTAVLMGIGFTPQLAMARPQPPASPFKDGPCVTLPETPEKPAGTDGQDADGKPGNSPSPSPDPTTPDDATSPDPAPGATRAPTPEADRDTETAPGAGDRSRDTPPARPSAPPANEQPAPTPSKTPNATPSLSSPPANPWYDPLGLGKKLDDILRPGGNQNADGDAPEGDPSPAPPRPTTSPTPSATPNPAPSASTTRPENPGTPTADPTPKDAPEPPTPPPADPSAPPSPSASPSPSTSPSSSESPKDEDGKQPFPCPVEKDVAGTAEQPPAAIANQPWRLEASDLTLRNLVYHGVVNLTTPDGRTKQALKYTASSIDIGDMHQIVDGEDGKKYHVQAAPDSTSTIRGGKVTLYTERLEGNLFGLIPVVFTPRLQPPPIPLPLAYFTKVKIVQAAQFGGNLTVPGLRLFLTG
ncbi:hypothetical protein [Streptomyces sp. NPDC003077]|uniref:hypothetical protein n=1 Tax=Streptomyces sp. NPDC003077 TaxID=3154443 RepID=UPI0033AE5805